MFLQLDTEHGRGILRGVARFFRRHPEVTVSKFARGELASTLALRLSGADGIIARVATEEEERALRSLKVPVVNVSGGRSAPRLPTVNTDDAVVGRLAARHLISRGYRNLAFCGPPDHLASRRRGAAFAAEARLGGLPLVHLVNLPHLADLEPGRGAGALASVLSRLPRPIGIFGFTDPAAIAIAEACQLAGLRVPEDVAVLGVGNDLTRLDFAHVDVSSVQLNTVGIGEKAAESLWRWLQTGRRPPSECLLPPLKIATRRSTDLFAVDDEAVALALDHIRSNVANPIYVADVARAAGVSRRILEMRFRKHLGTSVYAEVQRAHFDRAIELMGAPDLTLSEIAYASGFDSAQRFCVAFRRRFGAPPGRYRQAMRDGRTAEAKAGTARRAVRRAGRRPG